MVVDRSNAMLVQWHVGLVTCRLNGPFNWTIYTPVFEHQGGLVVYMKHCPLSQVIMLQGIYIVRLNGMVLECHVGCRFNRISVD